MRLVLASSSPRRAALLDQLGLSYEATPADIDETPRPSEPPAAYVERLAREKVLAVSRSINDGVSPALDAPGDVEDARRSSPAATALFSLPGDAEDSETPSPYSNDRPPAVSRSNDEAVIAADTAVVLEGHVLGKPAHPEEARSMLRRLQGERHEVFTGVAVGHAGEIESLVDVTHVQMLPLTDSEISDYVNGGEPMDKAGSYALQGRGGVFIETISGSPFTVVGLPIHLLPRLLKRVGADMELFRRPSRL